MSGTSPPVPSAVLREARRIVEAEPAIEAIILFGSRARGDHHAASDYDLAIVSSAPFDEVREACEPLARANDPVQIVPVDSAALHAYRNTGNRIERGVVVDGKTVAGAWVRPRHRDEATDMDHKTFADGLQHFAAHAKAAISGIALAKTEGDDGTNDGAFNAFRAGEHAAKAILALYGLTPRVTHGVPQLAQQLRDARAGAPDRSEREALAREIDALNGNYTKLNAAGYPGPLVEKMQATEQRLTRAARLAERCVDLHARRLTAPSRKATQPPDAHKRAVERIGRILHGSPKSLYNHPDRNDLAPTTNEAIESVCDTAAAATRVHVSVPTRLPGIKPSGTTPNPAPSRERSKIHDNGLDP